MYKILIIIKVYPIYSSLDIWMQMLFMEQNLIDYLEARLLNSLSLLFFCLIRLLYFYRNNCWHSFHHYRNSENWSFYFSWTHFLGFSWLHWIYIKNELTIMFYFPLLWILMATKTALVAMFAYYFILIFFPIFVAIFNVILKI